MKTIERHELANGLRVCISPHPSSPVVAVSVWYGVGSADEVPGRTGLAHLFEHLMFQGSRNVGKAEHFSMVQAVGGRANAATGLDRTFYYERLPPHELELAIWLEAERMEHLLDGLDQANLDNQRDVVRNERRFRIDNQPYGDAEERLQALLYPPGHPYAHEIIGSMEDLAAATLDDAHAFFRTYYSPANAVVSIAGDVDPDTAIASVERHFGRIPRGAAVPARRFPEPRAGASSLVTSDIDAPVSLPRTYLSYPIPPVASPTWEAFEVIADLLARGRASRLYEAVVRSQLAQEVNAWVYPLVDDPARLTVDVTGRHDSHPDGTVSAVLAEIERLGASGPSDRELDRVRLLRRTEHARDMERMQETADRIGMWASLLGTPERLNEEVARYEAVDANLVRDVVGAFLLPDRRVQLTYHPAHRRGV
ncbi:MAG TPA: pitrilysin family protein [Candidatus Limnocylindria bacterium]|nr:pitrilysin family protein [Candidatus Limnocylindria bacterium]